LEEDRNKLAEMRAEIDQLVGTPTCSEDGQCRFIGLGSKPCGGPWGYLIYSTANVDSVVLKALVAQYNQLEAEINKKHGLISDCSIPAEPVLICVDGVCVATGER
jgi:hypothetical protein